MKIILASSSPRRKNLLKEFIKDFEIMPSNFDEDTIKKQNLNPNELVEILSKEKGEDIYSNLKLKEDFIIISSDTMVYCNGEFMGKPKDNQDAFRMLKKLQNNIHSVYTGLYVIAKVKDKVERNLTHSKTDVYFKEITDEEILKYLEENDVLGKAGGYAIQEEAGKFVDKIEGEYNTVVGLDTEKLKKILKKYIKL